MTQGKLVADIMKERGWLCEICRGPNVSAHHLIKRSQCGTDEKRNLVLLCHRCHEKQHSAIKGTIWRKRRCSKCCRILIAAYPFMHKDCGGKFLLMKEGN